MTPADLTLPQVIELAGISETQIARLRKAGRFPEPTSTRPNSRVTNARPVNLWTRESIDAWRQTRAATAA